MVKYNISMNTKFIFKIRLYIFAKLLVILIFLR